MFDLRQFQVLLKAYIKRGEQCRDFDLFTSVIGTCDEESTIVRKCKIAGAAGETQMPKSKSNKI